MYNIQYETIETLLSGLSDSWNCISDDWHCNQSNCVLMDCGCLCPDLVNLRWKMAEAQEII